MRRLPALAALPFFEAAGRHNGFKGAAAELCITSAAVAHRIKGLEESLGFLLFDRHPHGVRLNRRGAAYLADIQRVLGQLEYINERHRTKDVARALKLITTDVLAERWLMPTLSQFAAAYPEMTIAFETDYREFGPAEREFDLWIAFTEVVAKELDMVVLSEETLVPVCSRAFLEKRGRPARPQDLRSYPLLYDLSREEYWALWFASHGTLAPDLTRAWGFRHYSMLIQAALEGVGVALGYSRIIAPELEEGTLVRIVDSPVTAPARYVLFSAPGSESRSEAIACRQWLVDAARTPHGFNAGDAHQVESISH